jgi:hypothetical protein
MVFAAVFGAMLMRLWDALRFDARYVAREEMKAALVEFEQNKIQPLKDRISKVDGRLDSIWQMLDEIKLTVTEIKSDLKHERER